MIRRYDHRLDTIGSAISAEYTSVEERPCPDLHDCIGEIHGLMYTAMLTEPGDDFAYALWVDDDGEAFPCYVIQKDTEHPGALINFMTPDVWELFESYGPDWHQHVLEIIKPDEN
jgi:hypothetical protein